MSTRKGEAPLSVRAPVLHHARPGPQNMAFAGRDKKTHFVVGARAIWKIQMEVQGFKGRAK